MKQTFRRFAGLLALACVSFALTNTSAAGGRRGGANKPPPAIPYTAIVSVDTAAKTITVGPKNSNATGTKTYKFTDKTVVTNNGNPGTLSDLVPGQQIHIGTGMDETVAEELKVTAPPAAPTRPGSKSSSYGGSSSRN